MKEQKMKRNFKLDAPFSYEPSLAEEARMSKNHRGHLNNQKPIGGKAEITAALKKFQSTQKNYEQQLHRLAVSVLAYCWGPDGDGCSLATRLVNDAFASSKHSPLRRAALVNWFVQFGQYKWRKDTQSFDWRYNWDARPDTARRKILVETATQTPFWCFEPEDALEVQDFQSLLVSLARTAAIKRYTLGDDYDD